MNVICTKDLIEANSNSEGTLILQRSKDFKSGTQNAMFGYFRHLLRLELAETIAIFQCVVYY